MSLEVQITHEFERNLIDVDFSAGRGVTALFGPSGAGKTTVIKAIAGLFHPNKGRVVLQDEVLLDTAAKHNLAPNKRRAGYVFQDGRLFPHLTVAGNIRFGSRFAPRPPDRAEEARVVALLRLEALLVRRPKDLSGGEIQRVALARALLSNPRILLMDEPLAALDEPHKQEILPYLERLRDTTDIPILYVSHALAEVGRLADNMVVLKEGRVVCNGTTQDVLSDPAAMPLVGVREAGAVLSAKVVEHGADGLSRLQISAGELFLPGVTSDLNSHLKIRVLAQDIILSLEVPKGLSSRNILPVTVLDLHRGDGPGVAVQLQAGDDRLLARITRRAAEELHIEPGLKCYAILKATAVPRGNIGADREINL